MASCSLVEDQRCSDDRRADAARACAHTASNKHQPLRSISLRPLALGLQRQCSLFSFPYVCPEPVLVN
jgi:hypothetical protein